jgi:hypothetical protein
MKQITWTDERGMKHRALIRDTDPDSAAPAGIPLDPPDLDRIDWESLKRELHNMLLDQGIVDWLAWQQQPNVVNHITAVVKRHLVALYREEV